MGLFIIEFARNIQSQTNYEDYSVNIDTLCGDDAVQRDITFNNISGDFVLGYNYNNTTATPQNINIIQFKDLTTITEISNGNTTYLPLTANQLRNDSTGNNITYPYIIPINQLSNISQVINQPELTCGESGKFTTQRIRTIIYTVIDSNNIEGPIRTAQFINNE